MRPIKSGFAFTGTLVLLSLITADLSPQEINLNSAQPQQQATDRSPRHPHPGAAAEAGASTRCMEDGWSTAEETRRVLPNQTVVDARIIQSRSNDTEKLILYYSLLLAKRQPLANWTGTVQSHTRFRLVPKSTTLDDLEGSLCILFQNTMCHLFM